MKTISKPLDSKNKRKNAERYIRISLESLRDYQTKGLPQLKVGEGDFKIEADIKPLSKYEEFIMDEISFTEFYRAMKQNIS